MASSVTWLLTRSQGAEIFDVALCGGGDANQGYTNTSVQISAPAVNQVKAVILMGDPAFVDGLSYNVGTCRAGGVSTPFVPQHQSRSYDTDGAVIMIV